MRIHRILVALNACRLKLPTSCGFSPFARRFSDLSGGAVVGSCLPLARAGVCRLVSQAEGLAAHGRWRGCILRRC